MSESPNKAIKELDVLWLTAGLGCDGETIAMTAATQPSLEELLAGALPGLPKIRFHNPVLAYRNGDDFLQTFHQAATGQLENFILIVEGSIPDESNKTEGYWAACGVEADSQQPITTCEWLDRLVPHAWAVMAVGTCAAYGGIHAMPGNPTGCMGLADYLGWAWRSRAGLPIVNVPGCPTQPDTLMQTLLALLRQAAGTAPAMQLDEALRPAWLFNETLHECCDRGGHYEQGQFADEYGAPQCIVKLGCWGPVVQCSVGRRGWVNGVGGCANVGGTCIGCTMPAFPEKFMSFMEQPPGSLLSAQAVMTYGKSITALRRFTQLSMNQAPAWRQKQTPITSSAEKQDAEESQ